MPGPGGPAGSRPASKELVWGTDERAELNQLRSEVAELRMERDVLT